MSDKRQRAKRLLKHYLKNLVEAHGHHWNSDNDAEVDEIVDCIIDGAVEAVKESQPSEFDNFVAHVDNANRLSRIS